MYKTPKFYGPQLLYQMVKVHFYFFAEKVLLLKSYHKITKVFPWIFRIYPSTFKTMFTDLSTSIFGKTLFSNLVHTLLREL